MASTEKESRLQASTNFFSASSDFVPAAGVTAEVLKSHDL
jgi:hypothetical protein